MKYTPEWNKQKKTSNKYTEICKRKNKNRNNSEHKRGQFASQSRMRASDIVSKFHSYGISAAPSDTGISTTNNVKANV